VDSGKAGDYSSGIMFAVLLKNKFAQLIAALRQRLSRPTEIRYLSTPVWKPWRDY
jgi:Na+-translocating ferredoxin:NAD+ oxidoreductase RnfD subunit